MAERIVLSKYPRCPKCKSDMVPLSYPHNRLYCNDYELTFGAWRCVKCKHEVETKTYM